MIYIINTYIHYKLYRFEHCYINKEKDFAKKLTVKILISCGIATAYIQLIIMRIKKRMKNKNTHTKPTCFSGWVVHVKNELKKQNLTISQILVSL